MPYRFGGIDDDEVKRERVRGVFAVGAIAVLFYLRQMNGNQPVILIEAPPGGNPVTTDFVMVFWGLYVLFAAMAFSGGELAGDVWWMRIGRKLLKAMYGLARVLYVVSVLFLGAGFLYVAAKIIAGAPQIFAAIFLAAVVVIVVNTFALSWLRKWTSHRRSTRFKPLTGEEPNLNT